MFESLINKQVDKRLREILDERVNDTLDRYAREAFKSAVLVQEPEEIVTRAGSTNVIYEYSPRAACFIGGYIDLAGMAGEDTIQIKIEMKLTKEAKWRKFYSHKFTGVQDDPLFFLRDYFVVAGVKVTLEHQTGVGKKFYHCFYRRR